MATALLQVILGMIQVPIQEKVLSRFHGFWAELATWGISLSLSLLAVWATGGFAGGFAPPPWDWLDPSESIAYWSAVLTPTRLAAAMTYQALKDRRVI